MTPSQRSIPPVFNTTRWSVIESARSDPSAEAAAALEQLCTVYWPPVYAFARCLGNSPEDSCDLAQGFFLKVIEGNFLIQADRDRGRFRSFLLSSLKHFIFKEHAKAKALRRGGKIQFLHIDKTAAESGVHWEPADKTAPDKLFDRQWALTLLDQVMADLNAFYRKQGEERLFETLQPCLATGRDRLSYAELGALLGLSEGAVKVAVHRMRKRYRDLLRRHVADTVASPEEVEAELRHLMSAISST